MRVKEIENTINHDVKSVEYYIKERIDEITELSDSFKHTVKPFVHFGLTSQDITTVVLWLQLQKCELHLSSFIIDIEHKIADVFNKYKLTPMLSRTHGQIASPTTIGKEFAVFYERLKNQRTTFEEMLHDHSYVKFGGCIGNFNALHIAYPNVDWIQFTNSFLKCTYGFNRAQFTTQIDHYDMMSAYFDYIKRVNTILIDFCKDIWDYISRDYLKLKISQSEVGSSTMPHKVNPIDFENAEGNLQIGNCLLQFFSSKLPVSRLQRDLTDSTISRNFGVAFGYCLLAYKNISKGLGINNTYYT